MSLHQVGHILMRGRASEESTPLKHVVTEIDGAWFVTCNTNPAPAIRDFRGYDFVVTCPRCRTRMNAEKKGAPEVETVELPDEPTDEDLAAEEVA
jgi:hypothetical protein